MNLNHDFRLRVVWHAAEGALIYVKVGAIDAPFMRLPGSTRQLQPAP